MNDCKGSRTIGQTGVSDTARYKLMGNAITVPIAVEIFKRLKQKKGDTKCLILDVNYMIVK